jgi:hypothetical protein
MDIGSSIEVQGRTNVNLARGGSIRTVSWQVLERILSHLPVLLNFCYITTAMMWGWSPVVYQISTALNGTETCFGEGGGISPSSTCAKLKNPDIFH